MPPIQLAYGLRASPLILESVTKMGAVTASYSHSLRAIGQALETLQIHAFMLEKKEARYIVRDWEQSFLTSIAKEVWGTGKIGQPSLPTKSSGKRLIYSDADTERLEVQGRSRRGARGKPGSHTLSSGLRLMGDYLDKQKAVSFDIWWSVSSVKVRFEAATGGIKETSFTLPNLHDLAVAMYLRRSER